MHYAARQFVAAHLPDVDKVIEIGSLNVNGEVRDLLPHADWYGIDLKRGPGVDEIADGATWDGWTAPLVISCEVLEHAPNWREIVANMLRLSTHYVLITCAGPNRLPHSADGGALHYGEYYSNIHPDELRSVLEAGAMTVKVEMDPLGDDVGAIAVV